MINIIILTCLYLYLGLIIAAANDDKNEFFAWLLFWPLIILIKAIRELNNI